MWVSRFSIPIESCREDVAVNADLALHTTDEAGAIGAGWNQAGHRLAVLGDHDAFRIEIVQQRQALFFEFRCVYPLHNPILPTGQEYCPAIFLDQLALLL